MTKEGDLIAGRYRLVSQVGAGAMGVVWQARDERLHRTVAVKQLLLHSGMSQIDAEEANRRAMREGRITARLHHPHAITVYDVAEHDDQPCLIMEYLPSESLSTVLATRGALPPEEVARIGSQIAAALAAAHMAGIVHRDIKPGNVLLADDGTAKITDFGISRAVGDGTVTATGVLAGTPAYLAPEVAQGQDAGFPADVFSLGATLYAAVEGVPPFGLDDNALALLYQIATSEIPPPTQSGPLTPVLERILERDPSQRLTMRQAQDELAAIAELPSSPVPGLRIPTVLSPTTLSPTTDSAAGPDASIPRLLDVPATGPLAEGGNRRPPRWAIISTAVTISLIVVGLILMATLTNDGSRIAGPASTPPGAQDTSPGQQSPQPSPTAEGTTETTSDAGPPAEATASPPTDTASPQDTPEQLRAAVSDYYALMPANLQEGWTRLTTDYQTNHAGGFAGYQTFWDPIQRVDVSSLSATPPGTVEATISYFFLDGRVITEQTSFGLVAEDGRWKIGSSTVTSSRTTQG